MTGELTGEARKLADELGEKVCAVLIGDRLEEEAASLIPLGADNVYVLTNSLLSHYDGKAYQKALAPFFKEKRRIPSSSLPLPSEETWHPAWQRSWCAALPLM